MSERERKPGQGQSGGVDADAQGAGENAHAQNIRMRAAARARREGGGDQPNHWNATHPSLVEKFNKLTNGACGTGVSVEVSKVRAWQSAHGLEPDGKIGPKAIEVAGKESGGDKKKEQAGQSAGGPKGQESGGAVDFNGDAEAEATIEVEAPGEGANLAELAVKGHTDGKLDVREDAGKEGEENAEQMGKWGSEAIDKGAEAIGAESSAVGGIAFLAKVPHARLLLREHRYRELCELVSDSISFEQRAEFIAKLVEGIAGELSPRVLTWLTTGVAFARAVDVSGLWYEWVKLGLKSMKENRERGFHEADAQIYAFAYSDVVLYGSHDGAGAVTPSQKEATGAGVADGAAMVGANPELRPLLLAEYKDKIKARHAVMIAVMRDEGFKGFV